MSGQSDAIFAKFVLKARMVTDEDLNACVGYQSRLKSEGKHISLGQALIKKRLLKASQFLQIRKRLETQTFLCGSCQAPFTWKDVEGQSDARCSTCNNLLSAVGFDGSAKDQTSEGRPRVALPAKKEKSKGARFGRYEILELIGQGGMGLVYKARQMDLNRVVAIKMLKEGEGASPEQVERFKREAQSAAKLQHPNIIGIHEVGVESGYHYFTMDYVEGDTLQDCFNRADRFEEEELMRLVEAIARGLHYAHTKGVVHRDVKPANIILDSDRNPKITDFGLAKIETDSNLTKSGVAIGTPLYMSPEQARGDLKAIDNRSDLFSLGIIMYQMATGKLPFIGDSHIEIYNQIIYEESAPPRKLNPKLSRDGEIIILKALEKLPRNRYQSCGELAEDIARTRVGEAILAKPLSLIGRFMRTTLRHRAFLGGVVIGLVLLVVVLIAFAAWSATRPEGPGPVDEPRAEALQALLEDFAERDYSAVLNAADSFASPDNAYHDEAVTAFLRGAEAARALERVGEDVAADAEPRFLGRALRWADDARRDEVYLRLGEMFLRRHDGAALEAVLESAAERSPSWTSLAVRRELLRGDFARALELTDEASWIATELARWTPVRRLDSGEGPIACTAAADDVLYVARGGRLFRYVDGLRAELDARFQFAISEPDTGPLVAIEALAGAEQTWLAVQRQSGRLQLGTVVEGGVVWEYQSARLARGELAIGDLFGTPTPEVLVSGGPQGRTLTIFEKRSGEWQSRDLPKEESTVRALAIQESALLLVNDGNFVSWLKVLKPDGNGLAMDLALQVGRVSVLGQGQEGLIFGRSESPRKHLMVTTTRPNGVYAIDFPGEREPRAVSVLPPGVEILAVAQHLGVSFCLYTVLRDARVERVLRVEGKTEHFEVLVGEPHAERLYLLDFDGDADVELVLVGPDGLAIYGYAR